MVDIQELRSSLLYGGRHVANRLVDIGDELLLVLRRKPRHDGFHQIRGLYDLVNLGTCTRQSILSRRCGILRHGGNGTRKNHRPDYQQLFHFFSPP